MKICDKIILILVILFSNLIADSKNLHLSKIEQSYLQSKKLIKMCNNPNWAPIEFTVNGDFNKLQGISIDTIHYLEDRLNIIFQNVPTLSWAQSQEYLKEKKCDILSSAVKTKKREKYANFTKPYLNLPLAIFTTKDKKIVSGLDEIMDKTWTRQKSSGLITKLQQEYPNMTVIETKGDREALMYVNSKKAYFTIATLPVASHVISKYMLNDLHIAGYTNIIYNLSMAVRKDDPILLSIIDKTLQGISKNKEKSIFKKWVSASVKEPIHDYNLLWKIMLFVFVISLFIAYRQYLLKKTNQALKLEIKKALEKIQSS